MISLARRPLLHTATSAASRRASSTVAATTISSDIPLYVTDAPEPQITTLDNGVVVASLFTAE